jgi:adenylate cyclase
MSPAEFSQLISRFFAVSSEVLSRHLAWIDRFVGDQVVGYFVPGFAGPDHSQKAIQAANEILDQTGRLAPAGPWIPVGVGIHTGIAFVGSVGSGDQATDITALGDAANTAARLASSAMSGEILISEAAYSHSGLQMGDLQTRSLELKGKSKPIKVFVLTG